jgi:hypothetical protein
MPRHFAAATALAVCAVLVFSAVASADDAQPKRRHPSYSLLGRDAPPADSPLNPNFVVSQENSVLEGSLWHSGYIPERLVGLAVGNMDENRSNNEMVYATQRNVYVVRRSLEVMEQLAVFNLPPKVESLSVDLFDVDGDGREEVILSAQQNDGSASSYVLSYDGTKNLAVKADGLKWYLRVVGARGAKFLAAQKSATTSNSVYTGKVVRASFQDGRILPGESVPLPHGVNLYNFNVGSLGGSEMIAVVRFPSEQLRLYAGPDDGDKIWESNEEYCGTVNSIKFLNYGDHNPQVEFLPSRLIIDDIDGDGVNEIIAAKNSQSGLQVMKNLRTFNGGLIEAFKFTNLSLVRFFSSLNLLPGPAVDYQLADFDNNGQRDLVVAVIIEQGSGMMVNSRSIIVSYSNLYAPAGGESAPAAPKK